MIKLLYAVMTADLVLIGLFLARILILGITVQLNVNTNVKD